MIQKCCFMIPSVVEVVADNQNRIHHEEICSRIKNPTSGNFVLLHNELNLQKSHLPDFSPTRQKTIQAQYVESGCSTVGALWVRTPPGNRGPFQRSNTADFLNDL